MKSLQERVLEKLQQDFGNEIQIHFHDEKWDGKHFFLDIESERFIWKSRVEQSKLVYESLDTFMKTWSIHALRMKCRIPE